MGARSFIQTIKASSPGEAFQRLVSEATFEHGHSSYNGTVSTCSIGRCTLNFEKYLKANEKKAYAHIKANGNGSKYVADFVDLGVCEYVVRTTKKVVKKGVAPKYQMRYMVRPLSFEATRGTSFESLTKANAFARSQALKTGCEHEISKEYVLVSKSNGIASFTIEERCQTSKPKCKKNDNKAVIPVHKYWFYGFAAE